MLYYIFHLVNRFLQNHYRRVHFGFYILECCVHRSLPDHEKGDDKDRILQEKEAELRKMKEALAKMQAQMQTKN